MSLDLSDLKRLRITPRTRAWLAARAHATGSTQQEIARDALDEMARNEIHAAKVLVAMAPDEAHDGDAAALVRDGRGRTRR